MYLSKHLALVFVLLLTCGYRHLVAATLLDYKFDDNSTLYDPIVTESNISAGQFAVGAGVTQTNISSAVKQSGRSLYSDNGNFFETTEAGAIASQDYLSFTLSVASGYEVLLDSLTFYTLRRTNVLQLDGVTTINEGIGAPTAYSVYSSIDGFATPVGSGTVPLVDEQLSGNPFTLQTVDLSALQSLRGTTEFRIFFWAGDGIASPGERVWRLDELSLSGFVEQLPATVTLVDYKFDTDGTLFNPAVSESNLVAGPFSFGAGVEQTPSVTSANSVAGRSLFFANNGFYAQTEGDASGGAVQQNDYLSFTLSADTDYQIDLESLTFYIQRQTADGIGAPSAYAVYTSADDFTTRIGSGTIPVQSAFSSHVIDMSSLRDLSGTTEFRIILWAGDGVASPSQRVFRLDELSLTGFVEAISTLPPISDAIYVSPDGDDSNDGSRSAPLASFNAARLAARAKVIQQTADITVYFDPGDYVVDDTVVFDSDDSGRFGYKVIYRAAGAPGSARILGAEPVTGWTVHSGDIWKVTLPSGFNPHTLYENRERAHQARFPNHSFSNRFNVASATYLLATGKNSGGVTYNASDLPAPSTIATWDLSDAELVISPNFGGSSNDWELLTLPLVTIDTGTQTLQVKRLSRSSPDFASAPIYDASADDNAPETDSRYFLQGVLDFLDQPGEFHFESSTNTLYYWPRDGMPESQEILVPKTSTIMRLLGDSSTPVSDLCFDGLHFEGADFTDYYPGAFSQSVGYISGMVRASYTRRIEFQRCRFSNAGFTALIMHDDNADNVIESCLFERASGGIWLNTTPALSNTANDNHRITNCLIQQMGELTHAPAVGIKLQQADNCEVAHCHIRDVARWGISIRGRAQGQTGNAGLPGGNVVRHSIVERACQDSGDTGALHTANVSVNVMPYNVNTYRQMIVRDTGRHPSVQDSNPNNGIFTDFESFGQQFEDVWVTGTADGAADYRENPVQGPDGDLVADHTFINVSWEPGFDPNQMETDSIGLRPDFPAEFLPEERLLFREDFNAYATGVLDGQGGWVLDTGASPTVIDNINGTDGTNVAGPATGVPSGALAAERIIELGTGSEIPIIIEFDLTQQNTGSFPSFGIGRSTVIPATVGTNQSGNLIVRGEQFGTISLAYRADQTLFNLSPGVRYRIRSIWSAGEDQANGEARLYVKNLSASETEFTQLFFDDGNSGLTDVAPLELITDANLWDRAWMRVGNSSQQSYFDNIEVWLAPPSHAVNPFEAWRLANFTPTELADPAISGPSAAPAGDGVANIFKFVRGAAPMAFVPDESRLLVFKENGEPRIQLVRALDSLGLESAYEVSADLVSWEDFLLDLSIQRVEEQNGLRTTVFGPVPGTQRPDHLFFREQYRLP